MGPRILSSALASFDKLVGGGEEHQAPDLSGLLADAGIDPDACRDPGLDVPLDSYARLLEAASSALGKDTLGLDFARQFPIGGTRVLGYLMRNAPDLATFVRALATYLPIQVDGIVFRFEDGPPPRAYWVFPTTFLAPRRQMTEFLLALFVLRVRSFFDPDFRPVAMEVDYSAPRDLAGYHELFGRNVGFQRNSNNMTLRPDSLALKNHGADALLFETMCTIADEKLRAIARSSEGVRGALATDLVSALTDYFVSSLGHVPIDLDGAARALDLSPKELQIELRRRDTSFAVELMRVRRGLAERYLRDTVLPMSEIALHLGFSELSAFTRAAKGWYGVSPSTWRQQHRGGTAGPAGPGQSGSLGEKPS